MARSYNRKTRRSNNIKTKMSVREENEIKSLVLIIFIIAVVFGLMYLLTFTIVKSGLLDRGYTKPTVTPPVVDYENITIGTVFDKKDKEYYVLFDEFGSISNKSMYLDSLLTLYDDEEKKLPIYKVDMSYTINNQYKSEKSNPKASNSNELKINGVTLIKIKNGKNILYLDDLDAIAKEFGL